MARYTNRSWVTEEFPNNPLRCPACNKQDLRLVGCVYRAFTAEINSGVMISEEVDTSETIQQIHQVICHNCNICYNLEDQELTDLREASELLTASVLGKTGLMN